MSQRDVPTSIVLSSSECVRIRRKRVSGFYRGISQLLKVRGKLVIHGCHGPMSLDTIMESVQPSLSRREVLGSKLLLFTQQSRKIPAG